MDTKYVVNTMLQQIDIYNEGKKPIEYSVDVEETNHGTLALLFTHPKGRVYHHYIVQVPNPTGKSQFGRAQKISTMDWLRALKEIGNSYIRELNFKRALGIE